MGWESSGVVGFDLGPLHEGQMRTAKLKSVYNLLIIGPRGFGALSSRWIQFASVFRCARSSYINVYALKIKIKNNFNGYVRNLTRKKTMNNYCSTDLHFLLKGLDVNKFLAIRQ